VKLDWTAASLMLAANLYEMVPKIKDALADGKWILFDRYSYSSVAYSVARGLNLEVAECLTARMPVPDLVVFLSVNERTAGIRDGFGKEIFERVEFQKRVKEAFGWIRKPDGWRNVDVDDLSMEQVHDHITKLINI